MKKFNLKDYIYLSIIVSIIFFVIFIITKGNYAYGSIVDWTDQHYNIPDYFRNLFYETKQLIPSFSFNIGAGENIFYLSYYGLLSPIILISYFLPMVSMSTYIIVSSIIVIILSSILMYKFLYKHYSSNISFVGTLFFISSAAIIFHSHRHIMFINYMLFLIMGLFGVDKYFEENKRWLLILSIFLIIMTSYYYSIGSILCLVIYGIYQYIKVNKTITIKQFLFDGIKYLTNFIIPILMSMALILPTLFAILNGRTDTANHQNLFNLIKPSINYIYVLYDAYGMGLTSIFFLSIIEKMFSKKNENRFLSIIFSLIIIFPIFVYIMNGFMYAEGKALIPLIPLGIIMISDMFDNIEKYDMRNLICIIICFFIVSLLIILKLKTNGHDEYIKDFVITLTTLIIFYFYRKKIVIVIPTLLIALSYMLFINKDDNLVTKENLSIQNENMTYVISDIDPSYRSNNNYYALNNVNNIYNDNFYTTTIYSSINNKYYKELYFNTIGNEIRYRNNAIISPVNNIYFNTLMGNRYIISRKPMTGYNKIKEYEQFYLYENPNVYSIGYASSNIISKSFYESLELPYTMEAMAKYVIIDGDIETNYITDIEPIKLEYDQQTFYQYKDGIYYIDIKDEKEKYEIKIKNSDKDKILIINFDNIYQQGCSIGDQQITINGVTNKLTCKSWIYQNNNYNFTYTIPFADTITIELKKGHYELSNLKAYIVDLEDIYSLKNSIDQFIINEDLTKGDNIVGDIDVTADGYFVLTVPYDKGYKILVDGKVTNYELVNNSLIGFKISQGKHHIEINYTAPGLKVGKVISIIGIILFIIIIMYDRKKAIK